MRENLTVINASCITKYSEICFSSVSYFQWPLSADELIAFHQSLPLPLTNFLRGFGFDSGWQRSVGHPFEAIERRKKFCLPTKRDQLRHWDLRYSILENKNPAVRWPRNSLRLGKNKSTEKPPKRLQKRPSFSLMQANSNRLKLCHAMIQVRLA